MWELINLKVGYFLTGLMHVSADVCSKAKRPGRRFSNLTKILYVLFLRYGPIFLLLWVALSKKEDFSDHPESRAGLALTIYLSDARNSIDGQKVCHKLPNYPPGVKLRNAGKFKC